VRARVVGDGPLAGSIVAALRASGAQVVGDNGGLDALVFAPWRPDVCHPVAFEDLTDAEWQRAWQDTMDAAVQACVDAHARMVGNGGRIVLVVPTIALSGGARFAHWAAAAEGVRILAKSAARQWGADGITVNAVAVSPELALSEPAAAGPVSIAPPALRDADSASFIAAFALDPSPVTGQTITVDGGLWMA
jgi:3-oxoacyl-[acyl-carrier protein] reductase